MVFGAVIRANSAKAPSSASLRSGLVGVGTRKPKSLAVVLNAARRIKCSVLVAASHTMIAVSSAMATVAFFAGATAQAVTEFGAGRGNAVRNSVAARNNVRPRNVMSISERL